MNVFLPTCSFSYYAHMNNVSVATVRGWAEKGLLPTYKMGKHLLIDLSALEQKMQAQRDKEEGGYAVPTDAERDA